MNKENDRRYSFFRALCNLIVPWNTAYEPADDPGVPHEDTPQIPQNSVDLQTG